MSQKVLWSGRFKDVASDKAMRFTSSLSVDRRLAWYDVVGSIAHARMLGEQNILSKSDVKKITNGLKAILKEPQQ